MEMPQVTIFLTLGGRRKLFHSHPTPSKRLPSMAPHLGTHFLSCQGSTSSFHDSPNAYVAITPRPYTQTQDPASSSTMDSGPKPKDSFKSVNVPTRLDHSTSYFFFSANQWHCSHARPFRGCKKECAPVSSQDDPLQYARDKEMARAGAHGPGIMGYLLGATCQKKGQSGSGVLWRCVSSEPIASEGPGKPRK